MSPVGPIWACRGPRPKPKPRLAKPDDAEDDGVGAKGALGPPVNCCTMARKLVVSVLRRVVGVRREARERRRMGFATRPSGLRLWWVDVDADEVELSMLGGSGGLEAVTLVVETTVVTAVASEMEDGGTPWKSCCCW